MNETKNSFWLKILKKYYIVVEVIADETDLQVLQKHRILYIDDEMKVHAVYS